MAYVWLCPMSPQAIHSQQHCSVIASLLYAQGKQVWVTVLIASAVSQWSNAMDWTVGCGYPGAMAKVLWSWHHDRQISHWRRNKEPRHRPSLMWPLDFWQRYHYNSAWTEWSFQQMVLEKLESHIESYEPQPLPDSIHKKEFKMNPKPQCKKLNDKTSSRNIREYLQGLGWAKVVGGHRKQ